MPNIGDITVSSQGEPIIWIDEGPMTANGQLVSRRRNPQLYALIGTIYCDEDMRCCNSEYFNLPDLVEKPKEDS